MMTRIPTRFNSSGISMAEYVLIGVSVLVVSVAACLGIGKSLQTRFLGLKGDMMQHAQQAQTVQVEVAQAHLDSELENIQNQRDLSVDVHSLWTDSSNPNALCSGDDCISASDLTGSSVSTAGSNGDTTLIDRASSMYSRLAEILKANGADDETVGLLTKLANEGHTIADMQYWLNFDGSQKPNRARAQVNTTNRYITSESRTLKSSLATFKQLSAQMNASIENYPAEVRSLLSNASQVIISAGSSYTMWQTKNKAGLKVLKFKSHPTNVSLIHTNSNTICDNGGNQSECHQN